MDKQENRPTGERASAMDRVFVVGGTGLLGTALCYQLAIAGHRVTYSYRHRPLPANRLPLSSRRCDVTSWEDMAPIRRARPDWIIHAASLKAVDYCETHPEEARRVNVDGAGAVAEVAEECGARFLYIGTNDVFSGPGEPFAEDAPTAPLNVYARTKLEAEREVRKRAGALLIVRTTFHGFHFDPDNSFSMKALALLSRGQSVRMAVDQFSSIISNLDLAEILEELMRFDAEGVFHVSSRNALSRYRFALTLARTFGMNQSLVLRARYADIHASLGLVAERSLKATLCVQKVERFLGHALPTVAESIHDMRRTASSFATTMRIPGVSRLLGDKG